MMLPEEEEEQEGVAGLGDELGLGLGLGLPPGFKFRPRDEELIKYYLYNQVVGEPLPLLNLFVEKTLYGSEAEEPSQIMAGKAVKEELYIFTLIKKKYNKPNGKNIIRVAGSAGTWKNQKPHCVYDSHDNSTVIGFMTPFSFVGKDKNDKKSWIMHEYTLKNYPSLHDDHQGQWALCRIKRGSDKKMDDDNKVEDELPLCKTTDDQIIALEKTADEINEDLSTMKANKRMRVSYPSMFPQTTKVPAFDVGCSQKDNNASSSVAGLPHHPQLQMCVVPPIVGDDVAFIQNYSGMQLQPDHAQQDCRQSAYNDNGHEVLLFQPSSVGADAVPLQDHSGVQLMDTIYPGDDVNLSIEDYLSPPQPENNGIVAAQQDYCQSAFNYAGPEPSDQEVIDILKSYLADSNDIADNNAAGPTYEETLCQPAVF